VANVRSSLHPRHNSKIFREKKERPLVNDAGQGGNTTYEEEKEINESRNRVPDR